MHFNPLDLIEKLYSPLIKQSAKWHQALAYGVPGTIAVLIIIVLGKSVPPGLVALLALVILAPLACYVALDWRGRVEKQRHLETARPASGFIHSPPSKSPITSGTIQCHGVAYDIAPNQHLWLAVEAKCVWPKDGEVFVNRRGEWKHVIFEDGAASDFHIALYVAETEQGNQGIVDWLIAGKKNNGIYEEKKTFLGTRRLHRVENLQRIR